LHHRRVEGPAWKKDSEPSQQCVAASSFKRGEGRGREKKTVAILCRSKGVLLVLLHAKIEGLLCSATTINFGSAVQPLQQSKRRRKNTLGKAHTPNMFGLWPLLWQINIGENPNRVKLMKKPPGL
jgi:hypothetical protein